MILKMKLINHLRVLSHEFSGIAMMVIALYFLDFKIDMLVIFGIWFAILTLPVIYLHLEYYLANRGMEIVIENEKLTVISKNRNSQTFKFNELKEVRLYKSASLDKGGIPIMPTEPYHFVRIFTNSEEQITITCLMYPKLDGVVDKLIGVQKIRKRGFCTLWWK